MSSLGNLFTTDFVFAILRVTTPILFASLAAIICTRAGVVNIALEGTMLMAALFGVIGSGWSNSLLVGLLAAIVGGMLMSALMAYFALYLNTDIILTGIAINLLTAGGTVFMLYVASGDKGSSVNIQSLVFPKVDIPFIKEIPVLGNILSGHNVLTYVAFLLVAAVYIFLFKTPMGLRLRCVGENPNAADSVGIPVRKVQVMGLLIGGAIASLGGAYMSMGYLSSFSKNMISGRGFIALAAEAMGQSSPVATMFSSLLFGAAEASSYTLQSLAIPAEFVQMIPYAATILGLIIYAQARKGSKKKKLQKTGGKNE